MFMSGISNVDVTTITSLHFPYVSLSMNHTNTHCGIQLISFLAIVTINITAKHLNTDLYTDGCGEGMIRTKLKKECLTVTLETLGVVSKPSGTSTSTLDSVRTMAALAQSTGFSSSTGEASAFPVLVHRIDNPVDAGIITDFSVGRIHKNNFIILHSGILVYPVRVEDSQIGKLAADLLLGNRLKITLEFNLVDTLVFRLSEDHTAVVGAFTSSTTNTTADHDISLLGLISEAVSLIGTCGAVHTGDLGALTVFPSADAKEETEGVRLLVTPQFFHILVATHFFVIIF
mmetsp:Transcript_13566/g.28942  ORF Transcript_13566/g.28942 Transcript_13566/m.28942 type:complete len:288 (+) Transcript_13566:62-925(+)